MLYVFVAGMVNVKTAVTPLSTVTLLTEIAVAGLPPGSLSLVSSSVGGAEAEGAPFQSPVPSGERWINLSLAPGAPAVVSNGNDEPGLSDFSYKKIGIFYIIQYV